MTETGIDCGRLWRRLISCAAAYVLVLHSFLVAFAGIPSISAASVDPFKFELCTHASDTGPPSPAPVPSNHGAHCQLCVAASHSFLAAPLPSLQFVLANGDTIRPAIAAESPTVKRTSQPTRGPPLRT